MTPTAPCPQPVRTCFIAHDSGLTGGASLSLLNLLDGLRGGEVQPSVLVPKAGPLVQALESRRVPIRVERHFWWNSPRWRLRSVVGRARRNLQVLRRLRPWVQSQAFEVVYTNTSVTPIGALLAWRARLPHIWHLREFGDLDHRLRFDWGYRVHRLGFGRATATICNSEAVRAHLVPASARRRSVVIYNGVVWARQIEQLQERRASRGARSNVFTFALVGRLTAQKGQDQAIQALAWLRNLGVAARLLLIGDGERAFLTQCRRMVGELQLDGTVEFRGHQTDAFESFLEADAALVCSVREAMGRVTAEAMACGLPVIGRASGGTLELIQDGTTGLLYDGTTEALASVMRLCATQSDTAARIGQAARAVARQRFTIEAYAGAVGDVIRSVASTRGGGHTAEPPVVPKRPAEAGSVRS